MADSSAREIELDGRRIPFTLRRSARARWVRAEVGLRTGLRVTLPAAMEEEAAAAFLRSRGRWVVRTLSRFERLAARLPERPLSHGSAVPYLGRELILDLANGEPAVERRGDTLAVRVPRRTPGAVRRLLECWYRDRASEDLPARASALATRHGLRFRRVRIGDARSRWGSCSATGCLSFNWRLMLAPEPVADYLVAHELAHLAVRNHSPRFWARVRELHPGFEERERWLRRHGAGLTL